MTSSIAGKIFAVSFGLLLLSGCSGLEKTLRFVTASKNMKSAELQKLYGQGPAFDYAWASGVEGNITFDKSGSAAILYGEKRDSGSWNIQGEMLCTKWQELGAGKENCYTVYSRKRGAKYRLFNADGSLHATAFTK